MSQASFVRLFNSLTNDESERPHPCFTAIEAWNCFYSSSLIPIRVTDWCSLDCRSWICIIDIFRGFELSKNSMGTCGTACTTSTCRTCFCSTTTCFAACTHRIFHSIYVLQNSILYRFVTPAVQVGTFITYHDTSQELPPPTRRGGNALCATTRFSPQLVDSIICACLLPLLVQCQSQTWVFISEDTIRCSQQFVVLLY